MEIFANAGVSGNQNPFEEIIKKVNADPEARAYKENIKTALGAVNQAYKDSDHLTENASAADYQKAYIDSINSVNNAFRILDNFIRSNQKA
ncbi:MAG: hypothetical protein FWD15_02020 [Alphaproteobacteria bacterium]|nr:hypothetical protein [Alphaproteobacteria bacterium]